MSISSSYRHSPPPNPHDPPSKPSLASRFRSSPLGDSRSSTPPVLTPATSDTAGSPSPQSPPDRRRGRAGIHPTPGTVLSYLDTSDGNAHDRNDVSGWDWHIDGPGRRVGYDNLTSIDWIYEYGRERTRQRQLIASSPGLLGQVRLIADGSQNWIILVLTGIAVGSIAAAIDVTSDWLGDLKTGMCHNVGDDDGKWYLNKVFCCWGVDRYAQCPSWRSWSNILGVGNKGGSYIVEYLTFVLFSVLFATCASLLVNRFSIHAKQSGIPEIKTLLGGTVIRRFLGLWTLVVKSLGLCLAVASGMWLGKEGPLVHVACCCANLFMKLFPSISTNEARKRETLSAAAASGISVAFGSPIGGVLFSLEQLSYYFPDKTMWASFVCAMVAAVTLQAFDPFRTGQLVLYQVTYHSNWHAFELLPFATIGIIGGLYGAMFIKFNMRIASLRSSPSYIFANHPILEVLSVALLTALISFPITFLRAQSSELVEYLFAECRDITDDFLGLCKSGVANTGVILILLVSAGLGFLLASITFGLQIPAGILLPSMAVGALYGRVIGLIVEVWQREHPNFIAFAACEPDVPCITPGTYAVIGAASALAGATRMTVSIVVIMFELTGALTYVLPIMIAVMISKWVGDGFGGKKGIYESWIAFQGYPFLDNNKDDAPIPDITASEIMTPVEDLVCISSSGHTISSLRTLLAEYPYRGFPIITTSSDLTLLGYISRRDLLFALNSSTSHSSSLPNDDTSCHFSHQPLADPTVTLDLRPWMDQTPMTLNSKSSLMLTNEIFMKLGVRYVVFSRRGRLEGLVTKRDLWGVLSAGGGAGGRGKGWDDDDDDDGGGGGGDDEGRGGWR